MLDQLFGQHLTNLQTSLDRTAGRAARLTQNIANANTPGYKRQDQGFTISLAEAQGRRSRGLNEADTGTPRTDPANVRVDGSSVDMETEVLALAETDLHYQALTNFAARYFDGLRNVIREGR